uniref:Ubiquitin-like protease family profile domain-containing protein n=1 Tax=Neogobius melanostomus TaxID=47308 RepID=A0A8C6S897_9GOBI
KTVIEPTYTLLIQFPPPPLKGGITVTMEDLQCLDIGQYLNDVPSSKASKTVFQRSHIFSSFFYKQLTRRDNLSICIIFRVRTWTRHVDIFSKDFIFVPVNQEAHWYLVVICFPGLEEPKTESLSQNQGEVQGSESPNDDAVNTSETTDMGTFVVLSFINGILFYFSSLCLCRPCILVMDSLKRSAHERVFKLMREYLQSEWETRRGSLREFGPDQMESSNCQVPLQDNSSDCGLYLLHYVESFLKDPVVHFDLPLHLKFWFPRHQVRRKREEIRDLSIKKSSSSSDGHLLPYLRRKLSVLHYVYTSAETRQTEAMELLE